MCSCPERREIVDGVPLHWAGLSCGGLGPEVVIRWPRTSAPWSVVRLVVGYSGRMVGVLELHAIDGQHVVLRMA